MGNTISKTGGGVATVGIQHQQDAPKGDPPTQAASSASGLLLPLKSLSRTLAAKITRTGGKQAKHDAKFRAQIRDGARAHFGHAWKRAKAAERDNMAAAYYYWKFRDRAQRRSTQSRLPRLLGYNPNFYFPTEHDPVGKPGQADDRVAPNALPE